MAGYYRVYWFQWPNFRIGGKPNQTDKFDLLKLGID